MSIRLKLNHRRPEDCDHEALHTRPIDAACVKRRPRPVQDARPIADDIARKLPRTQQRPGRNGIV